MSFIQLQDFEYTEVEDALAEDGTVLTDGCGEISSQKATVMSSLLGLPSVPAAFQVSSLSVLHLTGYFIYLFLFRFDSWGTRGCW